jgi:hypothetical protein
MSGGYSFITRLSAISGYSGEHKYGILPVKPRLFSQGFARCLHSAGFSSSFLGRDCLPCHALWRDGCAGHGQRELYEQRQGPNTRARTLLHAASRSKAEALRLPYRRRSVLSWNPVHDVLFLPRQGTANHVAFIEDCFSVRWGQVDLDTRPALQIFEDLQQVNGSMSTTGHL